ncbi:hypothetical protein ACHMXB_18625 [Arthrobacter sp. UC242_113]|uniref:hypothetical protein n=1 Tax=Arthrobacter sp. UC242_113 TaxID=3374550 RepID=UPI0037573C9F
MAVDAAELQPFAAQRGGVTADHAVAAVAGAVLRHGPGGFGQVVLEDQAVVDGGMGRCCGDEPAERQRCGGNQCRARAGPRGGRKH